MTKSRIVGIGLTVLVVLWAIHFMGIYSPWFENIESRTLQFGTLKGHTTPATTGPSALVRSLRPDFPYSVIPGGAYSPGELSFADSKDGVVRAHYADFDLARVKMVRLTDDRFEYLSYRVANQIYWTKKKLRVPQGELLLSDGRNYARARCGNRLSDQPHPAAISAHEPDTALLTLPPLTPDGLPRLALAEPPVLGTIPGPIPIESPVGAGTPVPIYTQPLIPLEPTYGAQPVVGGGVIPGGPAMPLVPTGASTPPATTTPPIVTRPPVNSPPPVTTIPIPEPRTIVLVLISLAVLGWVLFGVSSKAKTKT